MSQPVDSAALSLADRSYQLSGIDAEQETFVDDGSLSQTREMNPVARRGLTPFRRGVFNIVLENTHVAAGEVQAAVDPYAAANRNNGFPIVDPNLFDLYLLDATVRCNIGAVVTWAFLGLIVDGTNWGATADQAGAAIAESDSRVALGLWRDFTTVAETGGIEHGLTTAEQPLIQFKRRLLPIEQLVMRSEVTDAVAITMILTCGIFPISLGQDAW